MQADGWEPAGHMQTQGIVDRRQVEDPGIDHAGGAAGSLFSRLKSQTDGAAQAVSMLVENFGDT